MSLHWHCPCSAQCQGLVQLLPGWVSGRWEEGMHYSWLAPDRVRRGSQHSLTPLSSPPVPRRQAGSLPTRSWWLNTAGSVAVRAVPCGYWQGCWAREECWAGARGLPCVCCLTTVGREKVCMLWGPKALEGAGSSLFHC